MKKIIKTLIVLFLGIFLGYYINDINLSNLLKNNYKAFQVGVYTSLEAANIYSKKYNNSIVI